MNPLPYIKLDKAQQLQSRDKLQQGKLNFQFGVLVPRVDSSLGQQLDAQKKQKKSDRAINQSSAGKLIQQAKRRYRQVVNSV